MKTRLLTGIIALVYGFAAPAFSAENDTARLTINGKITAPTCSSDIVSAQLQQRCGNITRISNVTNVNGQPAKGVTTEIVTLPGDMQRKTILNRYD